MGLFNDCGHIFVARASNPRRSDLQELIVLCKGKVANNCRNASVVVGEFVRCENAVCVKELWVLDSISCNKLKSFEEYLLIE